MLKLLNRDPSGDVSELWDISSLSLKQDEDVPADELRFRLAGEYDVEIFAQVELYSDGELVFSGITDEAKVFKSESALYTEVVCRSYAALLLDNESCPSCYLMPSAYTIFKRHAMNVGIRKYVGAEKKVQGIFNVPKGSSNWSAIERFSLAAYGGAPRVEADGTLNFEGLKSEKSLAFGKEKLGYSQLERSFERHKIISKIFIRTGDLYDVCLSNPDPRGEGVNRVRYLDMENPDALRRASMIFENSIKNSTEVKLVCSSPLFNVLGASVSLEGEDGFAVSGAFTVVDSDRAYTKLTLRKEKKNVDC